MAYVDSSGGTFTGNIGFGGVTPPGFVIHAEKAVSGDKLAYFYNTSSTGYGVRFQNGTDANYAIKVTKADGTMDTVQIFGDVHTKFGTESSHFLGLSNPPRREAQGLRFFSLEGGGDAGGAQYISNQSSDNVSGINTQWSGHSHLNWTSFGGWDGGSRFGINLYYTDNGAFLYEPDRPGAYSGFDSAGSWSYFWTPPKDNPPSGQSIGDSTRATSNNPYTLSSTDSPYYAGQVLTIDGGSQSNRTCFIASQRKEWPMVLAVTPDRSQNLPGIPVVKLRAGVGDNNRVELFIDGALRNIKAFYTNGMNVLYY